MECLNNTIKCTVIDEGVAASMMPLACWTGLGSPTLSKSMTMLTTLDGNSFLLHGILPSLQVQLGGNTMSIEVEVVDAPLDYNLSLGQNWIYAMKVAILYFMCHLLPF